MSGTSHPLSVTTNNHAITGIADYADITARDADSDFNTTSTNVNKVVRVTDADGSGNVGFFILVDVTPTWFEFGDVLAEDTWTKLTDTPSTITDGAVHGNVGGTALEIIQALRTTSEVAFAKATLGDAGLVIGSSIPFSDASGTLTLQNIDILDAITESTIETAIDTLANLTSIQGQTVFLSGALSVEAASLLNQDLTTDATPTFSNLTLTPAAGDANFIINNASSVEKFNIQYDSVSEFINLNTPIQLDISVNAVAELNISTNGDLDMFGAGSVTFSSTSGNVSMQTGAGDIDISSTNGAVSISSTSADINMSAGGEVKIASDMRLTGTNKLQFGTAGLAYLAASFDGILEVTTDSAINAIFRQEGVLLGGTSTSASRSNPFMYVPQSAGVPTGTPELFTGSSPFVFDTLNNDIYIYNSGWKVFDSDGGTVTHSGTLTDNFLVRGNGASDINIGGIFMSDDGNALTLPGTLETTPSNPFLAGSLIDSTNMNTALGIFVSGKYAYVVSQASDSLAIIDVSDPTNPTLVGSLLDSTNLNGAGEVKVSGMFAYVSASDRVSIIDISDPTAPAFVSSVSVSSGALYLSGNYIYTVEFTADSLSVIDISDPTSPILVGNLVDAINMDGPLSVYVAGHLVYVVSRQGSSIAIVDVSDPATPVFAGSLLDTTNLFNALAVYVSGRYAYVTAVGRLSIIDISDPTNPTLVGSLLDATNIDNPRDVWVSGNYAYLVSQTLDRLVVVDISNPTNPVLFSTFTDSTNMNGPFGLYVSGKYAYVVSNVSDSIAIVDINGIDSNAASIGNIEAGYLSVTENAVIANNLSAGSLNVGHNVQVNGNLAVTGTIRSRNPSNVIKVISIEEFDALAIAGVIEITEDTTIQIEGPFTVPTTTFNVTGGDLTISGQYIQDATLSFTGTGPFITSTAGFDVRIMARVRLIASTGQQLFNAVGAGITTSITIDDATLQGWDLGSVTASTLLITNSNFVLYTAPFVMKDVTLLGNVVLMFAGGRLFQFDQGLTTTGFDSSIVQIGASSPLASPVFIDPAMNDGAVHEFAVFSIGTNAIDFFDTSGGATGSYISVADNSISATAITSITNNVGVAVFNHAGSSPLLGSTVTISAFTTNTDYNGTFFVTATTATTFECGVIAFGTTETGSYLVNGITLTSSLHGLTLSEGITLTGVFPLDNFYDGGYKIYNIQSNSFDVAATFQDNQLGVWDTSGVNESNPQVIGSLGVEQTSSKVIAFGFTNDNNISTTITDGAYVAIDASTFTSNVVTQRFKLTNITNAIFELTSLEDFDGFMTGSLTAVKTGSTSDYRFAMSTNGSAPVFATANHVPMEVKTTKVNVALEFSVNLSKGDTIQIMVAGDGTSDNLTITDLVFGIK